MTGEAVALISASALCHNFRLLKALCSPAEPIAVIKANAYGHGIEDIASLLAAEGAEFFAVARLSEALAVRPLLPGARILILGHTPPSSAEALAENDLIQTVGDLSYAIHLTKNTSRPIRAHLKLDCGMGRLGLRIASDGAAKEARAILSLPKLHTEAVFAHLPSADDPADPSTLRLCAAARGFAASIGDLPFHLHASAALLRFGAGGDDFVRAGILLYGYAPSSELSAKGFLPAMRLYAPILSIRTLEAGDPVGYGGTFIAPQRMRAATLGIGYGDGFPRAAAGARLLIGGKAAPILGRICMDMTVCRVPHGVDAQPGELVPIFGEDADSLPSLARAAGTIPYELLSAMTARVQRTLVD